MASQKNIQNQNENRRVKITFQYKGFDLFLVKKPLQCNLHIPETIMLDKYGSPKDWIFNSNKLPHHPILKKRKQNLIPLLILKSLLGKHVNATSLSTLKNIHELKEYVMSVLNERKDAEFFNKRKSIEVITTEGDVLQLSLLQFLQYVGEYKQAEQGFYEKWKIIQERLAHSKLDEYYLIESVRRNHLIESKSSKFISTPSGNKADVPYDSTDPFTETLPSKQLEVTDNNTIQAYKFFDSFLNKKFFTCVQDLVDCIEKNYKCIVESITTRFVIDHNREPYLSSVDSLFIKPALKLSEMRQFSQNIHDGTIKLENYVRCLHQYLIDHPPRLDLNLHQPVAQQRGHRCKGDFCLAKVLTIPHIPEKVLKLPLIVTSNVRKMNSQLIEAVRKRKSRVVQKLKETRALDLHYELHDDQSSQFSQSDDEVPTNVKVCQTCFIFYLNVLKHFELDAYGNLVEKKPMSRGRLMSQDTDRKKQSQEQVEKEMLLNRRSDMKSLKVLPIRDKVEEDTPSAPEATVKRSVSQKLKPIGDSPNETKKEKKDNESKAKGTLLGQRKKIVSDSKSKLLEMKTNRLVESKLVTSKVNKLKISKPTNYTQAAQQLLQKLQLMPNNSVDEFIGASKRYYKDNLPQPIQRACYSSEWLEHLYDFMNNSPIWTAPGNRIKKRPEMTLKRLSELTPYPQIVSRSTFVFDTLICDEKTTIPFCMLSSSMVHNHNVPGQPYQNVFILHDIFDSYIQFISLSKQILEDCANTRIILLNLPGQSHTIYDAKAPMHPQTIANILDKLIYRLSSAPHQLSIFGQKDTLKFIGFGFGGYMASTFLSSCRSLFPIVKSVMLINSAYGLTERTKNVYESLLEVFGVEDKTTEDNAFLFYNKAINSTQIGRQELEDKAGLNSIRVDGRHYLLKNALQFWDETSHYFFNEYQGKVTLLYSKDNTLLNKTDMLKYTYQQDVNKTIIKNRHLVQIEGGHDIQAENYDSLIKLINQFLQ